MCGVDGVVAVRLVNVDGFIGDVDDLILANTVFSSSFGCVVDVGTKRLVDRLTVIGVEEVVGFAVGSKVVILTLLESLLVAPLIGVVVMLFSFSCDVTVVLLLASADVSNEVDCLDLIVCVAFFTREASVVVLVVVPTVGLTDEDACLTVELLVTLVTLTVLFTIFSTSFCITPAVQAGKNSIQFNINNFIHNKYINLCPILLLIVNTLYRTQFAFIVLICGMLLIEDKVFFGFFHLFIL